MSTDGSELLNSAYWNAKCKEMPSDATMILVEMGSVVDYYRPNTGMSWCEMFTSLTAQHEFSTDGVAWVLPALNPSHYGGSPAGKMLETGIPGDRRAYLSFWGSETYKGGCCHASYSDIQKWTQAFTIYYSRTSGISKVMSTAGTQKLNAAYWASTCKQVPSTATTAILRMGSVVDYYRPNSGMSWCEMFTSLTARRQYSSDGMAWVTPENHHLDYGGSADYKMPHTGIPGDKRLYVSFWGSETPSQTGGCCYTAYAGYPKWGQAFTIYYSRTSGIRKLMGTDGKQQLGIRYWATTCKQVPRTTTTAILRMGDVVDYFRPGPGVSWCEMFTSLNAEHQYSSDGVTWVIPEKHHIHYGGNADNKVPKTGIPGDKRLFVSFWGSETRSQTGGCCYTSYDEGSATWGQPFSIIVDASFASL